MDMRYHWLIDRVRQKQFDVYWRPGRENLGDYHTKHHSAQHQKYMRGLILHQASSLQVLRGCVKLLPLPQPSLRPRTDARTNPSSQRATQLRSVLARVYAVSRQNQITVNTSGRKGTQIPHLPLGDDSSPWGGQCSMYATLHGLHGCV
jgi:hypothetical protein